MPHMLQATFKKVDHVVVVERVIDKASLFAGFHNAQLTQVAQVMRNSRFADRRRFGQITHILFAIHQRRNDAQSAWVCQCAKELGKAIGRAFVKLARQWVLRFNLNYINI